VRAAALDNLKFWLDKGVDAFRLDAINFCFHDRALRDNPPKPKEQRMGRGFSSDNPYAFQYHYYNNTQPENLGFLEELRRLVDRYPGSATLGEISSEDSLATMADYTSGRRLHMGYSFELLTDDFSASFIRSTVQALEARLADGWPCWAISNHDVKRVLSRWGGDTPTPELAKLLTALVASLRGTVCFYQGEELGLPEAELAFDDLRDPFGIAFWPAFKGRDGCRTPMPWNDGAGAGFSSAAPWLPISEAHRALAVSGQDGDPNSVLNGFREFMRWRRNHDTLRVGSIRFLDAPEPVLVFAREHAGRTLLAAFNLGVRATSVPTPAGLRLRQIECPGPRNGRIDGAALTLPGHCAIYAEVES
jgi:alpha-glucosidase